MSLTNDIRRAAREELESHRERAKRDHQKALAFAYQRCPELEDVDRQLRLASLNLVQKMAINRDVDEAHATLDALRKKREELLKSVGMVKTATDYQPYCKECGDTGSINGKNCKCYERALTRALKTANLNFFRTSTIPNWDGRSANTTKRLLRFAKTSPRASKSGTAKTFICTARQDWARPIFAVPLPNV